MIEGNALFLVCTPCLKAGEADHGLRLADRTCRGWYDPSAPQKTFKAWLSKHNACGGRGNPDHFQLAHLATPNHDQAKLAPVTITQLRAVDA